MTQCTCLHSHLHGAGARRLAFHHHSARVQPVTYVATKFTSLDDRWRCSNLYYKSKYLHQTSTHSSLTLYQDFLIKRPYHTSRQLFKEESNDLKQKESSDSSSLSEKTSDKNNLENATSSSTDSSVVQKKETLWEKVVGFLRHYYNGFKLFFLELRICLPLMYKYLKSGRSSMKRREHIQVFIYFCNLATCYSDTLVLQNHFKPTFGIIYRAQFRGQFGRKSLPTLAHFYLF